MRDRHRFAPGSPDRLEARIVLNAGVGIVPVAVAPLNRSARMRSLTATTIDRVTQSFDRFTADYLQTQGLYFAPTTTANATGAKDYFKSFILARLDLLAQELTLAFSQLPGGLNRVPTGAGGRSSVLQVYLNGRITGTGANSLRTALAGKNVIPEVGTVTGTAATLFTQHALTAIEAARQSTLNSTTFLLNHTFKNGH